MQTLGACTAILAGNYSSVNSCFKCPPDYLSDWSPRDKPWDVHRSQADCLAGLYARDRRFLSLAARVQSCALRLGYTWVPEVKGSAVETLKLRSACLCRVRHCPICEWRRSLMWMARFLYALDKTLLNEKPAPRFIFLTLTQRNVPPDQLRSSLKNMNAAWARLRKRKEFSTVKGWIRTTEVTRSDRDGSSHPHFHVLLMVPPSYFKKHYLSHDAWKQLWREALKVDYDPSVHVRSVSNDRESISRGARETLKYAVKPGDLTADPAWLYQITEQLRNLRFVASGGVLKDVLKQGESERQLLLLSEGESSAEASVFFDWMREVQRYRREIQLS